MTRQAILEAAIQKAIDGGWNTPVGAKFVKLHNDDYIEFTSTHQKTYHEAVSAVIFNHDFAKALWGEDHIPTWKNHITAMVLADDPIKYLGEHLND